MPHSSYLSKPYLIFSTVGSQKEAQKIAATLVTRRLAACVNIVPQVTSLFRWRGKVDQAKELLLIIKSDHSHLKRIEKAIREHHRYEVPEIIAWPISWGHKPYLRWLTESVIARTT